MPENAQKPIPDSILRTWVEVPPDAWERLSEHRYRAPHRIDGYVTCVVVVFGETIGRGVEVGGEDAVYTDLFEHAARAAAHRVSCEDGTPAVRPDNEANQGVVGRCWWCGRWPSEHRSEGGPLARMRWDDLIIAERDEEAAR